jgi:hypothetical protein
MAQLLKAQILIIISKVLIPSLAQEHASGKKL